MRPDVMAKRYSRGTQEHAELKSTNSKELVTKRKKYDEVVGKVDTGI